MILFLQDLYLEKKFGLPSLLTEMMLRKQGLTFREEEYKSVLRVPSGVKQNAK